MRVPPLVLAVAATLAACVPAEGPLMRPGEDCLGCHGGQRGAPRWTVAGTLYAEPYSAGSPGLAGAHVRVTDATGWSFSLRTNRAGNFYTAEPVAFPLRVCAERGGVTSCMEDAVTRGGCNVCHGPQGAGGDGHARLFPIASGTAHAGVGCAECHGAGTAPSELRCAACHVAIDATLDPRHTATNGAPAFPVTDFAPRSDACLRCHADGQVDRTALHPTDVPGAPPHEDAGCTSCHDVYRTDKPWAADFATPPASWPVGSNHGCVSCHADGIPQD